MIIADLDEQERTCIICDVPDARFNLLLERYYKEENGVTSSVSDTDIWLCDKCAPGVKNRVDRHVTDQIELKEKEKLR